MFTGIITDLGRVRSIAPGGVTRIVLETSYDTAGIALGASIACNGACLSVIDKGPDWFAVEASARNPGPDDPRQLASRARRSISNGR